MAHFYFSDGVTDAAPGDALSVAGSEARHAIAVGRLRVGERLTLGDGSGRTASGPVTTVEPGRFELVVETVSVEESPSPALWLAQALAKGDRDELAIQAATELGVDGVVPWSAQRSVVRWEGAKVARNQERWASILREAAKQSMRARIPVLEPLSSTRRLLAEDASRQLVVLEPAAERPLTSFRPDGRDILLVVGPEGGVSPQERERFAEAGAAEFRLGGTVLRTSTAGPAAIAVLNGIFGRW